MPRDAEQSAAASQLPEAALSVESRLHSLEVAMSNVGLYTPDSTMSRALVAEATRVRTLVNQLSLRTGCRADCRLNSRPYFIIDGNARADRCFEADG